jgi:SAM-dependent methyltransferase
MTASIRSNPTVRAAVRRALSPAFARLDALRAQLDDLARQQAELAARVEQVSRMQDRLYAHQDRLAERLDVRDDELSRAAIGAGSLMEVLVDPGDERGAGASLRHQFDEVVKASRRDLDAAIAEVDRSVADLRNTNRLTQAMTERILATPPVVVASGDDDPAVAPSQVAPVPAPTIYQHPTPGFEQLYRAFEDRHRGSPSVIRERQREDYLDLLSSLDRSDLPVVDLGCGRGELVGLLAESGIDAVGVDSNLGQVIDGASDLFVEADLFEWLDGREDDSVRAVVSLHVVEHLPTDLQVRLVFEARRVLVPGGVLVLETPNTLSVTVGASNFWVDPTHERPVHPLFLEFVMEDAGFTDVETRLLHPVPSRLSGPEGAEQLVKDLNGLLLGPGDLAVVGRR